MYRKHGDGARRLGYDPAVSASRHDLEKLGESDWRAFRALQPLAVGRHWRTVAARAKAALEDESMPADERCDAAARLLSAGRRDAGRIDDVRRSAVRPQLIAMLQMGLLEPGETDRLSEPLRAWLEGVLSDRGNPAGRSSDR